LEKIMMQQGAPEEFGAYIGIDWADQTHFVSPRDANRQEVKRYKLETKPEVLLQWVNPRGSAKSGQTRSPQNRPMRSSRQGR
jgi:hypothetical protein